MAVAATSIAAAVIAVATAPCHTKKNATTMSNYTIPATVCSHYGCAGDVAAPRLNPQ